MAIYLFDYSYIGYLQHLPNTLTIDGINLA